MRTLISKLLSVLDMKTINVTFTDEEHATLVKRKGNESWHDFILGMAQSVEVVSDE